MTDSIGAVRQKKDVVGNLRYLSDLFHDAFFVMTMIDTNKGDDSTEKPRLHSGTKEYLRRIKANIIEGCAGRSSEWVAAARARSFFEEYLYRVFCGDISTYSTGVRTAMFTRTCYGVVFANFAKRRLFRRMGAAGARRIGEATFDFSDNSPQTSGGYSLPKSFFSGTIYSTCTYG